MVEDGNGALPGRRVGAERFLAAVGCGIRWRACHISRYLDLQALSQTGDELRMANNQMKQYSS